MDNDVIYENPTGDSIGSELNLESILADFKAEERVTGGGRDKSNEHSHSIVMEALSQTVGEAKINSASDFSDSEADTVMSKRTGRQRRADFVVFESEMKEQTAPSEEFENLSLYAEAEPKPAKSRDGAKHPEASEEKAPKEEYNIWTEEVRDDRTPENYAPAEEYEISDDDGGPEPNDIDYKQRAFSPFANLINASSLRRMEKAEAEKARLEEEQKHQPPEMNAEKAARFYMDQAQAIRLRCVFAALLGLVLIWLSYGWPAMGLLGGSVKIRILVCMILLLIEMVVGLDVITTGLLTLFRGKPSSESLVVVSCLFSIADVLYMIIFKVYGIGLPFCGVSGLSITFALLGNYLNCKSFALSFRTAGLAKSPSVILTVDGGEEGPVLSKSKRPVTGFVRKSEEADIFETVYSLFAPILIIFSIILSLFCTFASGKDVNFLHTVSACLAVSASFSAVFGFAFPYYILTKRLVRSGVAIAGYSGCADLGRIHKVVITDSDIFPPRTVSIAGITVSEGFFPDKVTSYTASMAAAAGMGIASAFTELMKKNAYSMQKVEDFACHEGGGVVARINSDMVYVGSSSFMQLMGIKSPKGSASSSAVYTAINDELAGIFEVNYVPVTSVQRGLVTLLRGNTEPVFAVRDFNVTPMLVKQKFRLPKDSYDFPSFADRYTISSPETEEAGTVAAMFSRGGLNSVAGVAKRGKSLYNGLRFCAALSVLGAFVGMILMLTMFWQGAYDSASCGNVLTFMLLWLVPVFVISYGLRR